MDELTDDPASRLEYHLAREFVANYITQAIGNGQSAVISPNKVFLAARFAGLKVSSKTIGKVLIEMMTK